MSVASLAGYLNTGGGGGSDFNTVTIGDATTVILGCSTNDQLLIAGSIAAKQTWVNTNYVEKGSDASLNTLTTTDGISATEYISTGNSITLKGGSGDGVLTVSANGTQLLFNGVAVQLSS